MIDLGFVGPKYTWMNCKPISSLILERINRCFANSVWRLLYPEAVVTHLPRTFSDHCLMLIKLCKSSANHLNKSLHFQMMWLLHLDFLRVVQQSWSKDRFLQTSTSDFIDKAKKWNVEVLGNLFTKKEEVLARLNGT